MHWQCRFYLHRVLKKNHPFLMFENMVVSYRETSILLFLYFIIFLALITHLILVFYVLHLINQTEINDISFTFYYWNHTFSVLFSKHTRTLSVSHVYLFSKKCPKVPSKVEGAALIGGGRLKKGRTYFKFRGIFHMKFWNLIIVSFEVTIHNYCRALKQKGSSQIL